MGKSTWAAVNVPTMWTSAQAADTQMAWEQVGAWARTHDLLLHHELRLLALQGELSAAWPPERSPAATAFVEHMDGLMLRVARAREDAAKNRDALKLLLESLASAKKDMTPIKQAWDEFEAQQATSPRAYKGQTWQETLNAKAQTRMERNDREVFEAYQQMMVPDVESESRADRAKFGNPPPTEPTDGNGENPAIPTRSSISLLTGSSVIPDGDKLQLAGSPSVSPSSVGINDSIISPPPNGAEPVTGRVSQMPVSTPVARPRLGVTGQSAGFSGSRALSGGISARPLSASAGATTPTAVGVGQRNAVRTNPVGGVISPASTGLAGIPPARGGGATTSDVNTRVPVPTLQWDVAQGGAPVIEPAPERPFELGPGVIGIDR